MNQTPQMLGDAEAADGSSFYRDDESVDTSPDVTPATFDPKAFLAGVRPTRRSVQVIQHPELVGDMERLAELYAEADEADDDDACDRLAAEFDEVAERFHASKRWFTLEKWSSERIDHFQQETAKGLGLDVGDDDTEVTAEHRRARRILTLHQTAAQIVSPEGVTYDDLDGLFERNEGELNKLVVAMSAANSQQAGAAKVATPGFSLRRSKRTPPPGSRRR